MNLLERPPRAESPDRPTGAPAEIIELWAMPPAIPAAPDPAARRRHRLGYGLVACGLALLPWIFFLATSLPPTTTAAYWSPATSSSPDC